MKLLCVQTILTHIKTNSAATVAKLKGIMALISLTVLAFVPPPHKTKVYLIGDSTISIKEIKAYPETGWGMPFAYFFDSTIEVDNRAKNGRSTRTFLSENLWSPVVAALNEGDYVFIQFGHNDESKEKTDRYTTPEQYQTNLIKFITEAKGKKAIPVLLTPVSRRKFKDGKAIETHEVYSQLVRDVAKNLGVPLIDLDKRSQDLYQQFGEDKSKLLFLQVEPGEHPNYPEGKIDNTHFSELGARKIAQLVLADIKSLNLELSKHIRKPEVKK